MKRSRIILAILIVAAAFAAAVNIFGESSVSVTVESVSSKPYTPFLSLSGTVSSSDYLVVAQSDAVISEVLVKKGDRVSAGQTVCLIDNAATQAMMQLSGNSTDFFPEHIVSKTDGKVVSVNAKSGEIIGEGETVLAIENGNSMQVTALVGEANIGKISLGQKAGITGNGFSGEFSATVTKIGETAKKVTVGTAKIVAVEVGLSIDNPNDQLKSGFTAKVKIYTDDESQIIVVPYTAVMQDEIGEYVYLYNNGKAVRTLVKTGRELSDGYEIISGVKSGDKVILTPQKIKRDNCSVVIGKEEA